MVQVLYHTIHRREAEAWLVWYLWYLSYVERDREALRENNNNKITLHDNSKQQDRKCSSPSSHLALLNSAGCSLVDQVLEDP